MDFIGKRYRDNTLQWYFAIEFFVSIAPRVEVHCKFTADFYRISCRLPLKFLKSVCCSSIMFLVNNICNTPISFL